MLTARSTAIWSVSFVKWWIVSNTTTSTSSRVYSWAEGRQGAGDGRESEKAGAGGQGHSASGNAAAGAAVRVPAAAGSEGGALSWGGGCRLWTSPNHVGQECAYPPGGGGVGRGGGFWRTHPPNTKKIFCLGKKEILNRDMRGPFRDTNFFGPSYPLTHPPPPVP